MVLALQKGLRRRPLPISHALARNLVRRDLSQNNSFLSGLHRLDRRHQRTHRAAGAPATGIHEPKPDQDLPSVGLSISSSAWLVALAAAGHVVSTDEEDRAAATIRLHLLRLDAGRSSENRTLQEFCL